MKLIIAGGRDYGNYEQLKESVWDFLISNLSVHESLEIFSGACNIGKHTWTRQDGTKVYGADGLGEKFAEEHGYKVKYFPANWKVFGNSAGPKRNKEMAEEATYCIVFWDKKSKGTASMIREAVKQNIPTKVVNY